MKKTGIIIIFFLICSLLIHAQVKYQRKIETGFLWFQGITHYVSSTDGWEANYLANSPNGFDINFINGIKYNEHFYTGFGIGYMNFKTIQGISFFGDFQYTLLKKKWTPLFDAKLGYSHIQNQYPDGTGAFYGEGGIGISYRLSEMKNLYFQMGGMWTQKAWMIPLRVGIRF